MEIREAVPEDEDGIRKIYRHAFDESEARLVSELAVNLLNERSPVKIISLVAVDGNEIIGHVAFSPVVIANSSDCQGYILAPLAVQSEYQRHGIGSGLVENGMQQLKSMGAAIVFVYGDPAYYGRFGFSVEAARQYKAPYELEYAFGWQASVFDRCDIEQQGVGITCVTALNDPDLW